MAMSKHVDISTLTWIKGEIDESLKRARIALETFIEDLDETQLPLVLASLHQIHGALHMVQIDGAARFVSEVEALAQALQDSAETRNDEVFEIFMRALLQLPNYLLGLEDGLPDSAIFLLPLINEMREVRSQVPLTESDLFEPDLSVVRGPIDDQGEFIPSLVRKMRTTFQAGLVNILRNKEIDRSLRKMLQITDLLVKICEQQTSQQFLWIARGFIEALQDNGLELTNEVKPLLGKLEQTLKVLATEGESGISPESIKLLLKSLLFHVACSSSSGAYVSELREAFELEKLLPSAELIQQAQGNLGGFNDDLKKTVSADIMEELSRVKDALDIFVRGGGQNIADLQPMGEGMAHIADTLGLLSEDSLSQTLREQVNIIQALVDAEESEADEQTLMGIAGAVLAVDYALRDWGVVSAITQADNPDEQVADSERTAQAKAEHQRVVRQVMGEAKSDLVKIREAIANFTENPADKDPLSNIPQWLEQITGSLTLLSYNRMAQVLRALGCYIDEKLIQGDELPPTQMMNSLANGIMSVEYYLESFIESKVHPASMIPVAEVAVAELGHSVDVSAEKTTAPADAFLEEEKNVIYESIELDEDSLPEVDVTAAEQLPPHVAAIETDIDAEILEIFDEEAQEAFQTISELLPRWKDNASDQEALADLRRAFHTLKGSGRLVGAMALGEFSWAYESLLNRLIDGTIEPTPVIVDLLEQSQEALPQLLEHFKGGAAPVADIEMLQDATNELAGNVTKPKQDTKSAQPSVEIVELKEEIAEPAPVIEPMLVMDDALRDIYTNEANAHLRSMEVFIEQCRLEGECRISGELLRALHTLLGSSRMAGVQKVAEISGQLESHVKNLQAYKLSLDETGLSVLVDTVALIQQVLLHLNEPEEHENPDNQLLLARISNLSQTQGAAVIEVASPVEDEASLVDIEASNPLELLDLPDIEETDEITDSSDHEDASGLESIELVEDDIPDLDEGGLELLSTEGFEFDAEAEVELISEMEPEVSPIPEAELAPQLINPVPVPVPVPAPAVVREYDEELLEIFLEEGDEILNNSDEALQSWNPTGDNREQIELLQRYLHTLKGGARMAGAHEIGDLSHELESMLTGVVDGHVPVSDRMFGLLQECQDKLAEMLDKLKNHQPLPNADVLVARVDALINGVDEPALVIEPMVEDLTILPVEAPIQAAVVESDEQSISSPEIEAKPQEPVVTPGDTGLSAVKKEAQAEAHRRAGSRIQHEMVRVRSDLLDNLVDVAGEASIYRARVEQQIGAFHFNLAEMDHAVERLNEQLRQLSIDTEAQMTSRQEEVESLGIEDFDPLEFDRFNHMQQLSRSMMETLSDVQSVEDMLRSLTRESETLLLQQGRVNTELQEGLMRTRMVPLVENAPRFRRIVRQTASELGKQVGIRFEGVDVEMDRNVVERIMAPLEHILRNAVAHGLEMPDARTAAGKNSEGHILINQVKEGTEVVVSVTDDGAGVNVDAVRNKAIERGLLTADVELIDRDIIQFILEPGFSTAETVSQVAGRGVGMDVVDSEIKQLGGTLEIASQPGKGSSFIIRLPMTLSISRVLLITVGGVTYAIPLLNITGIMRISHDEREKLYQQDRRSYRWLNEEYDLLNMGEVLGTGQSNASNGKKQPLLLVHSGDVRVALEVDELIGNREIVVKPLGRQFATLHELSGATILGDGSVVLILEIPALIRSGLMKVHDEAGTVTAPVVQEVQEDTRPTIMVVDDSITVRKVTTRLLERNDMHPVTAKDGVDALTVLEETVPDVMLLDIEMPRMDGYELATHMRNDSRYKHVPIIMITSRGGEKHKQRAMEIGVNRYLGKPFQEDELLQNINELLGAVNASDNNIEGQVVS